VRIAILGPTASGKSALAVALARRFGATVVNGDPFQAFEGLGIGSGQPDADERAGLPHLGFGDLPLTARPNPSAFGERVRLQLDGLPRAVLVTGSGLYLRGIWDQLTELPVVDGALVAKVRRLGAALGAPRLHRFLRAVDPPRAAGLHPNDGARIQRGLALHLATGLRASDLLTGFAPVPAGWKALVVQPDRTRQRARIAARVRAQFERGWPGEAEALRAAGHGADLATLRPLGYDLLLAGSPEAEAAIVQATQAYAKRQSTWFRNQFPGTPVWDPDAESLDAACLKLGLL
jgi:tRNA dimethylallyltransferase